MSSPDNYSVVVMDPSTARFEGGTSSDNHPHHITNHNHKYQHHDLQTATAAASALNDRIKNST